MNFPTALSSAYVLLKKWGHKIVHVVSISSGKDSDSTLLLAIQRFGKDNVVAIFCDTGNEHTEVFLHLKYLEEMLGISIVILKANFDVQIQGKRSFVARDQRIGREYETVPVFEEDGKTPVLKRDGFGHVVMRKKRDGTEVPVQKTKKIGGGRRIRWTNTAKRRALSVLHPTGNPFLDLCLWKGRFPSRKAQFCTEELKRNIAVEFQLNLIDQGFTVVSWQGVRRDESESRKNALSFEKIDSNFYIYRPIAAWTAPMTFQLIKFHGMKPNRLYTQGMNRVGCMPCINARKEEVNQIARRFPDHIDKISEWELLVGMASKRGMSTFFAAIDIKNFKNKHAAAKSLGIRSVIEWAKTTRGGKQYDLLVDSEEVAACSSSYGLCG